jgi:hypothetical protein
MGRGNSRFQEIVDVIGYDRAVDLSRAIGGITLWIARGKVPPELKEVLGEELAAKLAKQFESGRLAIPRAKFARDIEICKAFYQGETVRALALKYLLSERTIMAILEKDRHERSTKYTKSNSDRSTKSNSDRPTG